MFFAEWLQEFAVHSALNLNVIHLANFNSLTYTNRWCWLLHKCNTRLIKLLVSKTMCHIFGNTMEHRLTVGHLTIGVIIAQSQIVFHRAKDMSLALSNTVTSPLRSLLPSPVGDRNSEVPLCINCLAVLCI